MKLSGLLFLLIFAGHSLACAEFGFNPGLAKPNRQLILKTLGLGTLSKNMSQPEPLGTDSGLELSFVTEMINTEKIEPFIEDSKNDDKLYYPKILIGKGLYERADFFFHFIPFTSTLGVSEFGAMFRFNFFQASNFYSSFLIHGSSANFNNQLTTRNVGSDVVLGYAWEHFALTGGVGYGISKGRFVGGPSGITDSMANESESAESVHLSAGALVRYGIYNFALSYDHYSEPVYTAKIGILL